MTEPDSTRASFLPDFCGTRTVFVVILVGELLAIVLTLALPADAGSRWLELAMYSLFIQWVALSCIGVLCLSHRLLDQLSDDRAAMVSYVVTLVITLIVTEIAWWVLTTWPEPTATWGGRGHGEFVLRSLGITAIVSALALRYFYVQHQWRRQLEAQAQARFQALQARIRPHFFFNCMNTIASLTRRDPALAEEAVEDLADLFRVSMQSTEKRFSLEEELAVCERYLRIEKLRMGDRLQVDWALDGVPRNVLLPALSLQPLLENAIYHGIERLPDGGTIRIAGVLDGDRLNLTIVNPVPAGAPAREREGNQFAQENVRQRLSAYFGEPDLLRVSPGESEYRVSMAIPCDHENTDR